MIPQELIDLRQQMYHAHVAYLRARATLDAARITGRGPATVQHASESCQLTGREFDAALTALIQYLETMQGAAPWDAELQHTHTLQATVRRERTLIQ